MKLSHCLFLLRCGPKKLALCSHVVRQWVVKGAFHVGSLFLTAWQETVQYGLSCFDYFFFFFSFCSWKKPFALESCERTTWLWSKSKKSFFFFFTLRGKPFNIKFNIMTECSFHYRKKFKTHYWFKDF